MSTSPPPIGDLDPGMNRPEFSNRRCAVSAAASCDHHWAWVKPSGTNASARICQLCHSPDPDWLNHIVEVSLLCAIAEDDIAAGDEARS